MPHLAPDFNPGRAGPGSVRPAVKRACAAPRTVYSPPCFAARRRKNRGVAQPGRALGSGPRSRWFKSSRPDHFSVRGILVHIFHGPANSTHRRGGRFPLLLTRCGEPFSTADRSGAAALPWAGQAFSGAARRMRAARFVRLASNELQNGAPLRISEVGGGVGRSARAARPPRRAAGSAFWPAGSKGGSIPARFACRRR